jgi:glycosyltransferase involved in cell wall biosynthesis
VIILIPSYQPSATLVHVVSSLVDSVDHVVVVDDGSGPSYAGRFAELEIPGVTVLTHPANRGKGRALKTGFRFIRDEWPGHAVVTADGDGQHLTEDILRVAERLSSEPGALVLGGRGFDGTVPARSRVGNNVSRLVFRLAVGAHVRDTQTGLRGLPAELLEWAESVPGERFDYELVLLMRAAEASVPIIEIEITTVYLEGNTSSHFRPVRDSIRVMWPLVGFGASSLFAFLIDVLALQILLTTTGVLGVAVLGARLISGTTNFLVNRTIVFRRTSSRGIGRDALGYASLAVVLAIASYGGIVLLTGLGAPVLVSKVVVDVGLYVASFQTQRLVVFARESRRLVDRSGASSVVDGRVGSSVLGKNLDRLVS